MAAKCASCGGSSGRPAKGFCVETNQVLCEKCVGLQTYPGLKGNEWTFEEIDTDHAGVRTITTVLVNCTLVCFMLVALLRSGIGDDYFKGVGTCPALGLGRQTLARWDANLFYYYKSTLAIYCDIEDSFWRLLMDGWVRGVISGSDSLLLLLSTLPKAVLFKTTVSTFLRPVYGMLYAFFGMLLGVGIIKLEDLFMGVKKFLPQGNSHAKVGGNVKWFVRLPGKAKDFLFGKKNFIMQTKMLCWGLALSMALRLLVHSVGLEFLAGTSHHEAGLIWQLAFEPLVFWYLGVLLGKMQVKLDKTLWKKAVVQPQHPLTKWRQRPMKDVMELANYAKARLTRSWRFYKQQAEAIIHILFDDVFYMAIALRLLGILFPLAPIARTLVKCVGLGGMVQRHTEWVSQATGFLEVDSGRYLSDRLASFGFTEATIVTKYALKEGRHQVSDNFQWSITSIVVFCIWRFLVPFAFYQLERRWVKLLGDQQKNFKKEWKGKDWTDGEYAKQLQTFGSFWNEVKSENGAVPAEWQAPALKAPPPPPAPKPSPWTKVKSAVTFLSVKKQLDKKE